MKLNLKILALAVSIVFVLTFQLIAIARPFTGHFASYQTVMASIARNIQAEHFSDLLNPKTDAIIAGKRSLHLNQYPIPSLVAALGLSLGGSLEFWGRFQSVCFSLGCSLLIALIARRLWNDEVTTICATVFYLLSPLNLIYGQMFMSEPVAQFFWLLAWFVLLSCPKKEVLGAFAAGILFSAALASRVHLGVLLPFFVVWLLCYHQKPWRSLFVFVPTVFSVCGLWYGYTYYATQHFAHVHTSLFMQAGSGMMMGELFANPEFYWRFFKFFCFTLLTPLGFAAFSFSLRSAVTNKSALFVASGFFLVMSIAFLLPKKFFDHDFYLFACGPFFCLLVAFAVRPILRRVSIVSAGLIFLLFLGLSGSIAFKPIFYEPRDEKQQVLLARRLATEIKDAQSIVVIGNNSPVFYYYIDHPAWYLDLSSVGQKVESYMMHGAVTAESIAALESAMSSPVKWLQYLEQESARTLVLNNPGILSESHELGVYIRSHYVSRQDDLVWKR